MAWRGSFVRLLLVALALVGGAHAPAMAASAAMPCGIVTTTMHREAPPPVTNICDAACFSCLVMPAAPAAGVRSGWSDMPVFFGLSKPLDGLQIEPIPPPPRMIRA